MEKIKTAKAYLEMPDSSVSEVALSLGYQNMNHSIRLFKQLEGVTPKKYQMKKRAERLAFHWK